MYQITDESPKPSPLLLACLVLAGCGVVTGLIMSFFAGLPLAGGALAVLGLGPLFFILDRILMPDLLLGPSIYLFGYHALGYGLGPLGQHYILGTEQYYFEGMLLAQWGAVIGLVAYALVFPVFFRLARSWSAARLKPAAVKGDDYQGWQSFTLFLMAGTAFLLALGTVTGALKRVGGSANDTSLGLLSVLTAFSQIQFIVFFFLGVLAVKRRRPWLVILVLSYCGFFIFYSLQGSRGPILTALLIIGLGVAYAGAPRRKIMLGLFIAFLAFIPLAGIIVLYRSNADYTSLYDQGFAGQVEAFLTASQDFNSSVSTGERNASEEFLIAVTALSVDKVMLLHPDYLPYDGFDKAEAVLFSYIPKFLYPDRPEIGDSNTLAFRYGTGSDDGSTFSYLPTVGEGYRRFGWLGIPLMYALCALVFGVSGGLAWARRQNVAWVALAIFLWTQAPTVWSSTLNLIIYFGIFTVPKYFIFFFLITKLKSGLSLFSRESQAVNRPEFMVTRPHD